MQAQKFELSFFVEYHHPQQKIESPVPPLIKDHILEKQELLDKFYEKFYL